MRNNVVEEICQWNLDRDNLEYNTTTEFTMLTEEVQELLIAKQRCMLDFAGTRGLDPYSEDTFKDLSEEDTQNLLDSIKVAEADALADTAFVALGGLFKLTGGSILNTIRILEAVIDANQQKGKDKKDGKITKSKHFVGPESRIRAVLLGELNGE